MQCSYRVTGEVVVLLLLLLQGPVRVTGNVNTETLNRHFFLPLVEETQPSFMGFWKKKREIFGLLPVKSQIFAVIIL